MLTYMSRLLAFWHYTCSAGPILLDTDCCSMFLKRSQNENQFCAYSQYIVIWQGVYWMVTTAIQKKQIVFLQTCYAEVSSKNCVTNDRCLTFHQELIKLATCKRFSEGDIFGTPRCFNHFTQHETNVFISLVIYLKKLCIFYMKFVS